MHTSAATAVCVHERAGRSLRPIGAVGGVPAVNLIQVVRNCVREVVLLRLCPIYAYAIATRFLTHVRRAEPSVPSTTYACSIGHNRRGFIKGTSFHLQVLESGNQSLLPAPRTLRFRNELIGRMPPARPPL